MFKKQLKKSVSQTRELPHELLEFAEYKDCDKFAKAFVIKYPQAVYRQIMLLRTTTSDVFGIKEHYYLYHSWIEYEGMLLMAYSGSDNSYTVKDHFKINELTPKQLHNIIIEFKRYLTNTKENHLFSDVSEFINKVESYQRRMFHVGISENEKNKLRKDFNLADASTFTFEIKVYDIKSGDPPQLVNFYGGKTFKKIKYKIRKPTKRRRPTKRRPKKKKTNKKRKSTKRRPTKRRIAGKSA